MTTLPLGPDERPPSLPTPPPPTWGKPAVIIIAIIGLSLAALGVVGFIVASRGSLEKGPSTAATPVPVGWTTHTIRDAGFRVGLPPEWQAVTDLDEDALDALRKDNPELADMVDKSLGGGAISDVVRLYALDTKSPGAPQFITNMNVILEPLPRRLSLSEYVDANLDQLQRVPGADIGEVERGIEVNGFPAAIFRWRYPLNTATGQVALSVTQYVSVRGKRGYVLTLTTTADQESGYRELFARIGATLQLL